MLKPEGQMLFYLRKSNKFRSMALSVRISVQYTWTGILEVTHPELQAFGLI